jgi:hypothetical protein
MLIIPFGLSFFFFFFFRHFVSHDNIIVLPIRHMIA